MAEIRSITVNKDEIIVNLRVSKSEYEIIPKNIDNIILLPSDDKSLSNSLTTGKLGNSNRIMLPKKILSRYNIKTLEKKVPAKVFRINDEVFLLIKLKKSKFGIPTFEE
ncbi:MAG: hypothetical protein J7K72_03590 [Candidatus Aenigmarchaeota archaeon]|nr:hypothetical protein [Candidatus Aenigmarchaeota archaeon]